MVKTDASFSSSITTNNSAADINQLFSNCRLSQDFKEVPHKI